MNISDYFVKLVLFLLVGFQLRRKKINKVQNFPIDKRGRIFTSCSAIFKRTPEGEYKVERVNYSAILVHKTDKKQHNYVDVFVTVKGFILVRCLLPDRPAANRFLIWNHPPSLKKRTDTACFLYHLELRKDWFCNFVMTEFL